MSNSTTSQQTARRFKGGTSVITQRIEEVPIVSSPPIGIKTPLRKATKQGQLFDQHFDIESDVIDNFKNMLMTNYGERLMYPDFGANLISLLNERVSSDEWDQQASRLITNTVQKYMPQISLGGITTKIMQSKNDGFSHLNLIVLFSIPRLGIQNRQLEINITSAS